jgi:hypothetical protein
MRHLVVLLTLIVPSAFLFAEEAGPRQFYPTAIGTEWVYDAGGVELVERIAAHEEFNGELCLRVETVVNGNAVAHEHLAVRRDGVYRVGIAGTPVEPPLCFLKYTVRIGDHWDVKSKVNETEISGRFTLNRQQLTVPAGEFNAVAARGSDFKSGETTLNFTYYFVGGIGKVKQVISANGQEAAMVLKEFRQPK